MRLLFSIVISILFCWPVLAITGSVDVPECDSIIQRNGQVVVGTIRFEEPKFFLVYPCGAFVGPGQVIFKSDIAEVRWGPKGDPPVYNDFNKIWSLMLRVTPWFARLGLLFSATAALLWGHIPLGVLLFWGLVFTILGFYLARSQHKNDKSSPRVRRRAVRCILMTRLSFAFITSVILSVLVSLL